MDKDQFNVINAEVTSNEVETAIRDLRDKGKKFYGGL
ncbi:ORF2 in transposon ISC1058 [Sulfolobus islandicus L.S.2.15]|jgi:t-SNARE complex subunit (syntaxin)|nr:ORF2 in transposon ISC1058 [Sulfolobus islandicus L.S.2.15]